MTNTMCKNKNTKKQPRASTRTAVNDANKGERGDENESQSGRDRNVERARKRKSAHTSEHCWPPGRQSCTRQPRIDERRKANAEAKATADPEEKGNVERARKRKHACRSEHRWPPWQKKLHKKACQCMSGWSPCGSRSGNEGPFGCTRERASKRSQERTTKQNRTSRRLKTRTSQPRNLAMSLCLTT